MMKRKTLALIATATCYVGNLLMAPHALAQEAIAPPTALAPETIVPLGAPPPALSAPPANTGVLAGFMARPNPETASTNQRFWFQSDYLFAFMRGTNVPALVTTSPVGTSAATAGVLGTPGTSTLFGGQFLNGDMRSGLRLTAGYWFGGDSPFGIEGSYTILESQASVFSANSKQNPILARPFIDAGGNSNTDQAILVAFPGASTGAINARIGSGNFGGGSFDITEKALDEGWFKLVALVGYRFYSYSESARINQTLTETNTAVGAGTQAVANDSFNTTNLFNGFDMGFRTQFNWDQFSLELLTRCAFGDLQRRVSIYGHQTVTVPGQEPVVQPGGVLALVSNSGTFASHDWKAMPEFGLNFAWEIRPNVKLRAGYSFILLSGVARAVDQIDPVINPNLLPPANLAAGGPNRPAFSVQRTDMWIQSINIGLEFSY